MFTSSSMIPVSVRKAIPSSDRDRSTGSFPEDPRRGESFLMRRQVSLSSRSVRILLLKSLKTRSRTSHV